jgi:hypothetical protein
MMTGPGDNQVTSATILNIGKIGIKNNTTVMINDMSNKHKLHGQNRNKKNIREMKRVKTKSVLPSNRKRGSIGGMNCTMSVRRT